MAGSARTLSFSYDDLMLLATALEFFSSESRASLRRIPDEPAMAVNRARLERTIGHVESLLGRINDARR